MSTYDDQPDTQGTDPLDAELGEEGQGDLAPEDVPERSDQIGASIINEDQALGGPVLTTSPDREAGMAPGPDDVIYEGDNVDTTPYPADHFRPDPDELAAPDTTGGSSLEQGMDPSHATDGWTPDAPETEQGTGGGAAGTVPAGREGADSGAVDSVSVEGTSSPDVERSSQNDIAGVGPASGSDAGSGGGEAAPSGYEPSGANAAAEPGSDPQAVEDAPTQHGSADPSIAGVPDAVGPGGSGLQTGTRQDLNDATIAQQVQGIVVQMQGDLGTDRLAESEVQHVLEERLTQAGISADVEQIEQLSRQIVSGSAPTDVDEGEPGTSSSL